MLKGNLDYWCSVAAASPLGWQSKGDFAAISALGMKSKCITVKCLKKKTFTEKSCCLSFQLLWAERLAAEV